MMRHPIEDIQMLRRRIVRLPRHISHSAPARRLKHDIYRVWLECKEAGQRTVTQTDDSSQPTICVWRTQGDDKVRSSHVLNNGQRIIMEDGAIAEHPGEAYGCRCWAEPVNTDRYASQVQITDVQDSPDVWTDDHFITYYLQGSGEPVTLSDIGLQQSVIDYFSQEAVKKEGDEPGIYRRVDAQIIKEALEQGEGDITVPFENFYQFRPQHFSIGKATVSGEFYGNVRREGDYQVISGAIDYRFYDSFSDPLDVIDIAGPFYDGGREGTVEGLQDDGINPDFMGTPYDITGEWNTLFNATVKVVE